MELSVNVIERELREFGLQRVKWVAGSRGTRLSYAAPLVDGQDVEPNVLYVARPPAVRSAAARLAEDDVVVAFGPVPDEVLGEVGCPVLAARDGGPDAAARFLASAIKVFNRYNGWHVELERLAARGEPVGSLIDCAAPVFHKPLALWDSRSPRTLYATYGDAAVEDPEETAEMIDSAAGELLERNQGATHKTPYSLTTSDGLELLCCDITQDGRRKAVLGVVEDGPESLDRDRDVLVFFRHYIQSAFGRDAPMGGDAPYALASKLERLLDGRGGDPYFLEHALSAAGWEMDDAYACLVAEPQTKVSRGALQSIAGRLAKHVPSTAFIVRHKSIVFVLDLSKSGLAVHEAVVLLNAELSKRRTAYKLGASNVFVGVENLPNFYRQAQQAILLGGKYEDRSSPYLFEDYMLDNIMDLYMRNVSAQTLFPPGLYLLYKHDNDHGTAFIPFLREYVRNGFEVLPTCQILHISRGTAFNRLKEIRKITDMDLDSFDTRVMLRLSQHAMDWADGTLHSMRIDEQG